MTENLSKEEREKLEIEYRKKYIQHIKSNAEDDPKAWLKEYIKLQTEMDQLNISTPFESETLNKEDLEEDRD